MNGTERVEKSSCGQLFNMVSERYGEPHMTTAEAFQAGCASLGWNVEFTWQTNGNTDWYTDQHGEIVLQPL